MFIQSNFVLDSWVNNRFCLFPVHGRFPQHTWVASPPRLVSPPPPQSTPPDIRRMTIDLSRLLFRQNRQIKMLPKYRLNLGKYYFDALCCYTYFIFTKLIHVLWFTIEIIFALPQTHSEQEIEPCEEPATCYLIWMPF